ncbi:MAG TPA: hypothetical protein VJ770_13260 [Stellaceae bacterium]|nr:hypothetical protein [Stellaceae bacterium]
MWNISSEDVERAKERVQTRRSEIETRYAAELKALDAELDTLATLERAAADFTSKKARAEVAPDPMPEPSAEAAPDNGGDSPTPGLRAQRSVEAEPGGPGDRREGNPGAGSRWRLHLGNRPADAESGASLPAQR